MSDIQFSKEQDEHEEFTLDKDGEWNLKTEKKTTNNRINPEDYED